MIYVDFLVFKKTGLIPTAERNETYDLKSKKDQVKFKELTNTGNYLSEVFDNDEDLDTSTNRLIKRLENIIKKSFNKIRIKDKPDKELKDLYNKRNKLKKKDDQESKNEFEKIENRLSKIVQRKFIIISVETQEKTKSKMQISTHSYVG